MEHRWSVRKALAGSVVIDCPRVGRISASLCDISLGGLYVEMSPVIVRLDAPVVITFETPVLGEWLRQHALQAMVVRVTAGGVGFMFLEPEMDAIRSLRDFIYGPPGEVLPVAIVSESKRVLPLGRRRELSSR